MHPGRRDLCPGGGNTEKLAAVGGVIGASHHDQVPFSDLVLNRVGEPCECRMVQLKDLPVPLPAFGPIRGIRVIDIVRRE